MQTLFLKKPFNEYLYAKDWKELQIVIIDQKIKNQNQKNHKLNLNKMIKKGIQKKKQSNLILPKFECKCRKEYDSLSSLMNHIKREHNNNQQEFRLSRGVPGGRNKIISKQEKLYYQKVFSNEIKEKQLLTEDEIRVIFKQITQLISCIVQKFNVEQFEVDLQKENIRLQPLWVNIQKEKIKEVMQKYLISYLIYEKKQNLDLPQDYLNDDIFRSLKSSFLDEENSNSSSLDLEQNFTVKIEQVKQEYTDQQIEDKYRENFIKNIMKNNKAFQEVFKK